MKKLSQLFMSFVVVVSMSNMVFSRESNTFSVMSSEFTKSSSVFLTMSNEIITSTLSSKGFIGGVFASALFENVHLNFYSSFNKNFKKAGLLGSFCVGNIVGSYMEPSYTAVGAIASVYLLDCNSNLKQLHKKLQHTHKELNDRQETLKILQNNRDNLNNKKPSELLDFLAQNFEFLFTCTIPQGKTKDVVLSAENGKQLEESFKKKYDIARRRSGTPVDGCSSPVQDIVCLPKKNI